MAAYLPTNLGEIARVGADEVIVLQPRIWDMHERSLEQTVEAWADAVWGSGYVLAQSNLTAFRAARRLVEARRADLMGRAA